MRLFSKITAVSLLLSAFALPAQAAHNGITFDQKTMQCYVVSVLDGDTLDCVGNNHHKHRIRLANIDAPEKKQPFGDKSTRRLADLVFNRSITVAYTSKDRYGRIIGEIFPVGADGYAINYRLVQEGLAWAYDRYATDKAYITAQQAAKHAREGLWADKNPINPEQWRRQRKQF